MKYGSMLESMKGLEMNNEVVLERRTVAVPILAFGLAEYTASYQAVSQPRCRPTLVGLSKFKCLVFLYACLFAFAFEVKIWTSFCVMSFGLLKAIYDHFIAGMDGYHTVVARLISSAFVPFWVFFAYDRIERKVYAHYSVGPGCDPKVQDKADKIVYQLGQLPIYAFVMTVMHTPLLKEVATLTVVYLLSPWFGRWFRKFKGWVFLKKGISMPIAGSAH